MPQPAEPPSSPPRSNNSEEISDEPLISPLPIAALAPDPKNPRRMSDTARVALGVSMETFGALDIVFNTRTGELVSGHQRVAGLKAAGAAEVTMTSPAWGYIEHPTTGERFWVRFVDWDETKHRIANLVANNPELQGEFTPRCGRPAPPGAERCRRRGARARPAARAPGGGPRGLRHR